MMEIREIILGLQDLANEIDPLRDKEFCDDAFSHDYDVCIAAIDALKRCTQPENKPLTLEQLKQIDGEYPVYIKGNAYTSLAYLGEGTIEHEEDCFVAYYFGTDYTDFFNCEDYGKTWVAYAHKPEVEEK